MGLLIALVTWLPLALGSCRCRCRSCASRWAQPFFSLPQVTLRPLPMLYPEITERFTEFVVIIALMGAGLKIDRAFRWRRWAVDLAAAGHHHAARHRRDRRDRRRGCWACRWAIALLLAAASRRPIRCWPPTSRSARPKTGEEDEVRFGLTSEAGLNDGFAFPFVHLAIALADGRATDEPWFAEWLGYRVLWEIGAGVAAGWASGGCSAG